MSSIDIYSRICSLIEEGREGVLATIIKTRGSTPASALSKMVILEGGAKIIGTVGGGCVEAQVITESKAVYSSKKARRITYHMTEDDVEGGLICGGTVDIMLEPMHKDLLHVFKGLLDASLQGKDTVLGTMMNGDALPNKFLITEDGRGIFVPESISVNKNMDAVVQDVLQSGKSQITELEGSEIILEPVTGVYTVVIFGGGHVSKFVAETAQRAGFAVNIVDDRIKFASKQRFPNVERVICADFHDSFSQLTIHNKTCLVIVTRGHSYDEIVLEQALSTPAGYIGMIGSRRKISRTYDNLQKRGIDIHKLEQVFAPLGLDIGAQTAEEIAISIVAELIKFRRLSDVKPAPHFRDSMRQYFDKNMEKSQQP